MKKSLRNEKPWVLKREDYNGNVFVMDHFDDKEEAERIRKKFEDRGHKQTYYVEKNKVKP